MAEEEHHEEHHDEVHHDEEPWLVSYADMMTLLFGFFVLLYSFAQAKLDRVPFEVFDENFVLVRKELSKFFGGDYVNPLETAAEEFKKMMMGDEAEKLMEIRESPEGLEISFQSQAVFELGSANLKPPVVRALGVLAAQVLSEKEPYQVLVEGHTDDIPIVANLDKFPTNWELSAARAASVVRVMEKSGFDPQNLVAIGYGSSRPLVPNRDDAGRPLPDNQARNRRVLLKIMRKAAGSPPQAEAPAAPAQGVTPGPG